MPLILGHRIDGSPIWPLAGGAPDGDDGGSGGDGGAGDGGASGSDDGAGDGGDGLGEAGRRAIEAERTATRRARDELRPWKAMGKRLGLTPEQIEERLSAAGQQQQNRDEATIRREVGAEITQKTNARLVRAEVKALAAATFQDPSDVPAFLHLDDYEVDDEGNVDTAAIERDLKKLLQSKPYLGKQAQQQGADFDGGARTGAPRPKSMNELIRGAKYGAGAR